MARFIATNKDPDARCVQVEAGFKGTDGNYYLMLRRLPPLYARPPLWLVRLSADTLVQRCGDGTSETFYKAYSLQEFTDTEKQFLGKLTPGGSALPFLNFTYPNVIRVLGKKIYVLEDAEVAALLKRRWVFVP